MFNKELLLQTVNVQTCSEDETRMVQYIKDFLNFSRIPYTVDKVGNILATKGNADLYKCVACHMDTVHDIYDGWQVHEDGGILSASAIINGSRQQVGTGGDDKVGVFIALSMLSIFDDIKVAFFTQEEIGCIGSRAVDMTWFDDCSFIFQADRRGNTEVITNDCNGQLVSEEFLSLIKPHMDAYNLVEGRGSLTDVSTMKGNGLEICVCNIFAGYYNAHTSKETINIYDVERCLDFFVDVYSDADIVTEQHKFDTVSYNERWYDDWEGYERANSDYMYSDYSSYNYNGDEVDAEDTYANVPEALLGLYRLLIDVIDDKYYDDHLGRYVFYSYKEDDYLDVSEFEKLYGMINI